MKFVPKLTQNYIISLFLRHRALFLLERKQYFKPLFYHMGISTLYNVMLKHFYRIFPLFIIHRTTLSFFEIDGEYTIWDEATQKKTR